MSTKFYVNPDGTVIGGFAEGAVPDPANYPDAVAVDKKPTHGDDLWDFSSGKFEKNIVKEQEKEKKKKKEKAQDNLFSVLARFVLNNPDQFSEEDITTANDYLI